MNLQHFIFDCVNVEIAWKIESDFMEFDVKWKHVVRIFSVRNETTAVFNLHLSFIDLKIYKDKCIVDLNILMKHLKDFYAT